MKNKIIVLIPHYNNFDGLLKSIKSISINDKVDIVVVDDGSTRSLIDEVKAQKAFSNNIGDIFFIYLNQNKGIEHALNEGLDFIKKQNYEFIARLDCGDLCLKDRFNIQYNFLNINPTIKLIGSNAHIIDMNGKQLFDIVVPTNPSTIKQKLFISSSSIVHPTIMFNTEILKDVDGYPKNYKAGEDYAFYFKILKKYQISNINEFLLAKEFDYNSISIINRKIQAYSRIRIIQDNFYFGYHPVIGLLRSYLLYVIPNPILTKIKKIMA